MKRYASVVFPVLILLVVKLLFLLGVFGNLEHRVQDAFFRQRGAREVSNDVVIVAIDNETFSALDVRWPFPRSYHAKLIENLSLAGVRQIVFDVEFIESGDEEQDLMLAGAAVRHQNVVFAGKVSSVMRGDTNVQLHPPIAPISQQGLPWGLVSIDLDSDNFIRRYNCFFNYDQEHVYTLGVASLGNYRVYRPDWYQHIRVGSDILSVADHKIPLVDGNRALLNYYGPSDTFLHIPYSSILDDSLTAMPGQGGVELDSFYEILESGILKDKIVLVGATTDDLHDRFPTPFSKKDTSINDLTTTAGVEVHATFLEMVRNKDFLYRVNAWLHFLIELIALILLWLLFRKLKPQFGVLGLLILVIGAYILAYHLFTRQNLLIPILQSILVLILVYITSIIYHYIETSKEKRFIRNAFQQYMAPELVNTLLKNPDSLTYGGSLQEITVLFSDIRSFTTYSENHKPEETVQILKEYLTEMVDIIIKNQGILDKFVGDEVMALFGTPVKLPNHALSACRVALQMRESLTALQQRWISEGRESFEIGIGVNTGHAVVGNLGSQQIFDYTAIGDTINLGARLEAINKEYETAKHIIISEFTLDKVKDMVQVRYLDEVKVKGKNKSVKIYELIDILPGY